MHSWRRRSNLISIAFILAGAALAIMAMVFVFGSNQTQTSVSTPRVDEEPSKERGGISGRIVGAGDEPAADLRVWLEMESRKGRMSVATDANGDFRIESIPPGRYWLLGGSDGIGWIYESVEVRAGEELRLETVRLRKKDGNGVNEVTTESEDRG